MCGCVSVSQRVNERETKEGEQMEQSYEAGPPSKNHSITVAIKACHSSITQMYQNIKRLTDVKRVKEHVEMR